jgi:type IV secretion system protein VirB9
MNFKFLLFATLLCFGINQSFASEIDSNDLDNSNDNFNTEYSDQYFYGEDETLTETELNALKITANWKDKSSKTKPIVGPNGSVQFIFGGQSIDIVCAVLQVCDIELQMGEEVNSIHLGDSARWKIEPAITGYGSSEIQHLVIKPLDVGLKTNLLVTTNRRTYHINLKSHRSELMPLVSFVYPEDALLKFRNINSRKEKFIADNTIPSTNEYLGDLNFNYSISADDSVSWTPIRVYNNGQKTIIQLDENTSNDEIPTLLVLDKSSKKETLVNYRFINNKFIVDSVFKEAILIMGVVSKPSDFVSFLLTDFVTF